MVGLMNSFAVFASGTGLFPVVGSTGLFGWFLLLPPMEFSQFQEPATIASVAHPLPVEAGACGLLLPPSSPTTDSFQEPLSVSGAAVSGAVGNAAKLHELMALRARVGTSIGSPEDFQVALAALIEQDGQGLPPTQAPPLTAAPQPAGDVPPAPVVSSPSSGFPQEPSVSQAVGPMTAPSPQPSPSHRWRAADGLEPPHGDQQSGHPQQVHPQHIHPQAGHTLHVYPPHVPPHVQMQQGHPQSGQLPVPGQWSEQAGPIMIQPQVVPNHFVVPRGPQGRMVESTGPSFPFQQMTSPSATHPPATHPPATHPPAMGPAAMGPQHGPVPSHQVPNHDGPVRLSFSDQPNDHGPRNMYRPDMYRPDMQRPDMQRPDMQRPDMQRPDMGPDRSHRVRQAARRLEEAAWELEEVGEYELADDVRRQANQLYHRARGESLRLQSR